MAFNMEVMFPSTWQRILFRREYVSCPSLPRFRALRSRTDESRSWFPGFQIDANCELAQVRLHLSRRLLRKVALPDMFCQDVLIIQES